MKPMRSIGAIALIVALAIAAFGGISTPVRAQNDTSQVTQNQPTGFITWRGTVDNTVDISIQGSRVWTNVIKGRGVPDQSFNIDTPLPAGRVDVAISRVDGRGNVRVIQQPDRDNGYTAVIRIHDGKPGASFYKLNLIWQ